ncbi:MAG TPA: NADH:flavin oxidoreductase [Ruminiclostridium sp.]
MAEFEKFNFNSYEDLEGKIKELGVNIKLSRDLSPLKKLVKVGNKIASNSMAVLPMEGCDSNLDGSPSELVRRRYNRFAAGGAGLLWYEACAVVREGRANPMQLHINKENVGSFAELLKENKKNAIDRCGSDHKSISIIQLTHSGRYSCPDGEQSPMVPQHDPFLDPPVGLKADSSVITDEYLDALQDKYVQAAVLSREAGFDGVDIKACHRYLISELLASHTREGKYGGSFENRSRFLLETIKKVRAAVGKNFIIATRFNVFDAHPYPYAFGVDIEDYLKPDMTEPLALAKLIAETGVDLLSNSSGNPYFKYPYFTRPSDMTTIGGYLPNEHPLESVARMFEFSRKIQAAVGDIPVVGNGYSWLRNFLANAGAANIADGSVKLVGIGREAFAYPDMPYDILTKGGMDPKKTCITCSKCTQIMRWHGRTGCVIKDSEMYIPLYNEARRQFEANTK